jgi:hypothetical protein
MKFASIDKPDATIYVENGIVTIQHFDGAFSLHLRMTALEAALFAGHIADAADHAGTQKEAA